MSLPAHLVGDLIMFAGGYISCWVTWRSAAGRRCTSLEATLIRLRAKERL